jgi:hypothetical protein
VGGRYGHRYHLEILMLAVRLLVLNDKNKRKFVSNGMIPIVIDYLGHR